MAPVSDGEQWIKDRGYKLGYKDYAMKAARPTTSGCSSRQGSGRQVHRDPERLGPAATVARGLARRSRQWIVCLKLVFPTSVRQARRPGGEGH